MSQLFPSRNLHEDAIEFVINYHDGHESILPELLMFGEHLVIELHGYDWEAIKYNGITYLMKKIK